MYIKEDWATSQGQDVCIAWSEVREDVARSGAAYGALGCFLSGEGRAKGIVISVQREMSRKRQNFLECVNRASTLAWRAGKEVFQAKSETWRRVRNAPCSPRVCVHPNGLCWRWGTSSSLLSVTIQTVFPVFFFFFF